MRVDRYEIGGAEGVIQPGFMMFLDFPVGNLTEPVSDRRWDRATIHDQVDQRIVAHLHGGLQRGDRVFLQNGNRLEWSPVRRQSFHDAPASSQ